MVKWLLELNSKSINEVNLYGRSPLHIAAFNNNVDLCRLLVERGADLNSVMKVRSQYLTPLDAAHQNASEEVASYLQSQGAQPIAQIDQHLAEYLQTSSPIKELGARKRRAAEDQANLTSDELDMPKTATYGQQKSKDHSPLDADQTYTKLPNLIGNGNNHHQNGVQQDRAQSRTALSTASSCTLEHVNHPAHSKLHNTREFEANLALDKPTHLKQAIITNVYLTTGVPVGSASPVYYVKRVPPLKKGHYQKGSTGATTTTTKGVSSSTKRRSGSQGSRSRSRSKDQQPIGATLNGSAASRTNTNITTDDEEEVDGASEPVGKLPPAHASVILETHDTFESEYETRDDKLLITQHLTTAEEGGESSGKTEQEESVKVTSGPTVEIVDRVKRSLSVDGQPEGDSKQTEVDSAQIGQTSLQEVVEPLRVSEDDSGFETEKAAKTKDAKSKDAMKSIEEGSDEIDVEKTSTSKTGSPERKDSTDSATKGPAHWLQEAKD